MQLASVQDLTFNEDRELGFAIDECFDEGKSVAETVAIVESKGQFSKKSIWKKSLEIYKARQLKKQERFKRFGSVKHLLPGWTKADDFSEQWLQRQRPTPNVSWNLERDAEVHERMMAPLPVSRERPLPPVFSKQDDVNGSNFEKPNHEMQSNMSPTWKTRMYHQQKRAFHKGRRPRHPAYGNSAWVNPDYLISDSASTVTSSSMNSSALYKIDLHGYDDDDDDGDDNHSEML